MNAVSAEVKALVYKELASANERFPQFHSEHEGWAVMQEEAEELREECDSIEMAMEQLWHRIRDGISTKTHATLGLGGMPKPPPARLYRWRRWHGSTLTCWSVRTSEAVQRGDATVSGRDAAV